MQKQKLIGVICLIKKKKEVFGYIIV